MKILIVDDEKLARDRLVRMVQKMANIDTIDVAINGHEALTLIDTQDVDVMLLDIAMPGLDGMATAKALTSNERSPAIIFCTAYDNHALEAFGVRATGYLLKPVRQEDLDAAIVHAYQTKQKSVPVVANTLEAVAGGARKHIRVRHAHNVILVPLRDIRCFRADQKYVSVVTHEQTYLIEEPLKELETEFAALFVRVHRNTLVAISHITGLQTPPQSEKGSSKLLVSLNGLEEGVDVSRRHLSDIKKLVAKL